MDATLNPWFCLTRAVLFFCLMVGFGLPLFMVQALRDHLTLPVSRKLIRLTGAASFLGLIASVVGLWQLARSMSNPGAGWSEWATARMLITGSAFGVAWVFRVVSMALTGLLALIALPRRICTALLAVFAGGALVTLVWAGHGAMTSEPGAMWHVMADMAHLLAAGAWAGALMAFLLVAQATARRSQAAVALLSSTATGFAWTGTLIVGTLLVTGIANYLFVEGPSFAGLATWYGKLLLIKIGVFLGMLVLASFNRFRHAPKLRQALGDQDMWLHVERLKRSLWQESAMLVAVVMIVAVVGVLDPTQ